MDLWYLLIAMVMLMLAPAIIQTIWSLFADTWRFCQNYFGRMNERNATLARSGIGAFMIYTVVSTQEIDFFNIRHFNPHLINDYHMWGCVAAMILAVWGVVWLLLGFSWKARGPRDGHMIFGYLIKIATGVGLLFVEQPYPWLDEPIKWISAWCLITGSVKLILVLRGMPAPVLIADVPDDAPGYGDAGFAVIDEKEK